MFSSLSCKLRQLVLAEVKPAFRCYAAAKASEKTERLPPGFGKTTPFGMYIKEKFASRKNEQPTEVFTNLTKEWRSLSEDDKKKYVAESLRINEEKKSKFESLSEEKKEELRKQAQHLKENRLMRKIRLERKKERKGGSQRPMSGWMLFVKEKAVKGVVEPGKNQKDVIRELASAWKSLPNSEKDAYIERAKALSKPEEVSH